MKICVLVRTRNEEQNIARFCDGYKWADAVLVADGGSRDKTVEIARSYENVKVRDYDVFVEMDNGIKRNPHGSRCNFLIDWAFIDEKADWVIFDDCDCFPNKTLRENARTVISESNQKYIFVTRLYLWKDEGHFPKLAQPIKSGTWEQSLWAWRSDSGLRFRADRVSKEESHQELSFRPPLEETLKLEPPYALLHCPWQTDEMVERKLAFYRLSGQIPTMLHPLEFGGAVEPLPEWASL